MTLNMNTLKEEPQQLVDFLADVSDENQLMRKCQAEKVQLNLATAVIALKNHIKSLENNGEEPMDEFSLDNPDNLEEQRKKKEREEEEIKRKQEEDNKISTEASGNAEQIANQKAGLAANQPLVNKSSNTEEEGGQKRPDDHNPSTDESKMSDKPLSPFNFEENKGDTGGDSSV